MPQDARPANDRPDLATGLNVAKSIGGTLGKAVSIYYAARTIHGITSDGYGKARSYLTYAGDFHRAFAERILVKLAGRPLTQAVAASDATTPLPGASPRLQLVWAVVSDGEWHTIGLIAERCRIPETSVSARLRELREPQFGFTVERSRPRPGEPFCYRVVVP